MNSDHDDEYISKSELKRQMHKRQELGEALVKLSTQKLEEFEMPENLKEAILAAKNMHQRGAHKRQLQYIGKLMRNVDSESIQQQFDKLMGQSALAHTVLHKIERWREELIQDGDPALEKLIDQYPHVDRQHIRQLLRAVHKEQKNNKPPKAYRALFQFLKEFMDN